MPKIGNKEQVVTFSEIGGTITRWQYHGIDIFYPQQLVKRGKEREQKLRGGMHACWPCFGTVDPTFGLPQHGVLRNRKADEIMENGVVFRGTDLLGPAYDEECEVRIDIVLTRMGLTHSLSARLLRPASRDVFINPGLHPYFRTPTGNAQARAWKGEELRFYRRNHGPISTSVGHGADVNIPSIGKVQMLLTGGWSRVYYWRDSRRYLCVEPVFGNSMKYGDSRCLLLTDKWFNMSCAFQVSQD